MKIIIQAGHEGRTTGATGAPGEQTFNKDTANRVADKLRALGVEVKRVNADPLATELAGDWDLFLTIHYDADSYNADGGFVDFPEPSTDAATAKSQAIAKALGEVYFPTTGVRNVPSRSNANTRFYYMWKKLSAKTPCVIIECGVGNRKPKDNDPLNTNRELVVTGIVNGLKKGLGIAGETPMPEPTELLTYLGQATVEDAKRRLAEHLGEADGKSEWGNEAEGHGGFLGSARRDVKRLQNQLANVEEDTVKRVALGLGVQASTVTELVSVVKALIYQPGPTPAPGSSIDEQVLGTDSEFYIDGFLVKKKAV